MAEFSTIGRFRAFQPFAAAVISSPSRILLAILRRILPTPLPEVGGAAVERGDAHPFGRTLHGRFHRGAGFRPLSQLGVDSGEVEPAAEVRWRVLDSLFESRARL